MKLTASATSVAVLGLLLAGCGGSSNTADYKACKAMIKADMVKGLSSFNSGQIPQNLPTAAMASCLRLSQADKTRLMHEVCGELKGSLAGSRCSVSRSPSPSATPSLSTAASTAPPGPLTGPELVWLQAIDREQAKINSALEKEPTTPTTAQMLAVASVLRGCTTIVTRLGRPSDPRLLPVFEPMMKACAQFAKAAKCQTTLAVSNDPARLNKAASCISATTAAGGKKMATAEAAILQLEHPSG